jgi:hypothetical protein
MNLRHISAAVVGVAVLVGATGMGHSFASSARASSTTAALISGRPSVLAAGAKRHAFSVRLTVYATKRHAFSVRPATRASGRHALSSRPTTYANKRHAFSARPTSYTTMQPLTLRRLANTPLAFGTIRSLGSKAPSPSGRGRSLLRGAPVASRSASRSTSPAPSSGVRTTLCGAFQCRHEF